VPGGVPHIESVAGLDHTAGDIAREGEM